MRGERRSMADIPLSEQLRVVNRELAMRKRLYPEWVRQGRIKEDRARYLIEVFEALQATLQQLHTRVNEDD
jgi:hypothetical protein